MTEEDIRQLIDITACSIELSPGRRIYGTLEAIGEVQELRRRLRAQESATDDTVIQMPRGDRYGNATP